MQEQAEIAKDVPEDPKEQLEPQRYMFGAQYDHSYGCVTAHSVVWAWLVAGHVLDARI